MYKLSDRCVNLKEEAVTRQSVSYKIAGAPYFYSVSGLLNAPDDSDNQMLTAHAICELMHNFPVIIEEGELIVGHNYPADNKGGAGWIWASPPEDELGYSMFEKSGFTREQTEEYFKNRGIAHARYKYIFRNSGEFPPQSEGLCLEWSGRGGCCDSNHTVIGYQKVLELGFEGLLEQVLKYSGSNTMYQGMEMICREGCKMGERYADKARELLKDNTLSESRKNDLKNIINCCGHVPAKPARNFMEALQSFWFAHIINTWEDGINANSLGRLDQILFPYYQQDIQSGVLTKEEAFELICCMWIKLYRDYDVQQSCIGGCDENGDPAENELSYLMLDAIEQLDFIRCLSVRYSQKTSREFLRRALEVVGRVQKGVPFFFNDDVMIPALISKGIPEKDARDYTQIGCVETVIPGKSNPHAVTGITNILKAIEYAFNNGNSMMRKDMFLGIKTGELIDFKNYESFKQAVFTQIEHILDVTCTCVELWTEPSAHNSPKPYKSLLTQGCLESGRDFNNHGSIYEYYQICIGGIPNLADSLMAVKKLVFEENSMSLGELFWHLDNNYPDEAVRQIILNKSPKYGNDIKEVDSIAIEIYDFVCDCLEKLSQKLKLSFHAQPFTFLWMIDQGRETAATPDGRRKSEIIAYSVSPMQGRDFKGLTALLNSLSCLPTKRAPGTTSSIVEIDPKLFTDSNIDRLADILIAASSKGLCNVQFNLVDAETLRDAQKHPEKYNNLAVRVSGFSQKFNQLSLELQNHIIGRTKHQCL